MPKELKPTFDIWLMCQIIAQAHFTKNDDLPERLVASFNETNLNYDVAHRRGFSQAFEILTGKSFRTLMAEWRTQQLEMEAQNDTNSQHGA